MNQKYSPNQNLEPIPIPLKQWLRELRIRVFPVIVFIICGIVVAVNWTTRVSSPDFFGKVYGDKAQLLSPMTGTLVDFHLEPFSRVQAGDVIGRVMIAEPAVIESRLAVVNAQIEYLRSSREPEVDLGRNILNFENMKMDVMQERIELASLRIRKQRAGQVFARAKQLWDTELISADEFERAQSNFELLSSEVQEKEALIESIAERLSNLESSLYTGASEVNPTLAAINVQAQNLRLIEAELMPRELIAPIDGIVSTVKKKSGVVVTPGELIAEIETVDPKFIIGYVRQPFSVKPEEGMMVEVRSRRAGRFTFASEIIDVGAHIGSIETKLLRPGLSYETGLPVKIALAADVDLTPGEIVDLIMRPNQ